MHLHLHLLRNIDCMPRLFSASHAANCSVCFLTNLDLDFVDVDWDIGKLIRC